MFNNLINTSRAMRLNITYGLWAVVLQALFMHSKMDYKLLLAAILIIIGVILGVVRKK
ncbi:hypothetical protein [Clostridium sp.]|uniref:hypothetical protein n=1 Tax=Clostridium sp. TaxID=1506 RepID=UPI003995582A